MPRILCWACNTVEDIRVDQPYGESSAHLEVLTMCGSRIAALDSLRLATLGCLVRVGSKLYGLSAAHAFEQIVRSKLRPPDLPTGNTQPEDLVSDLLSCSFVRDERYFVNDEDECYLVDDVEYDLDSEETSGDTTAPLESYTPFYQDAHREVSEKIMTGSMIFPSDGFTHITWPDLDWALVEVTERQHQRPIAYMALTEPWGPVFLSEVVKYHPDQQRDIVKVSVSASLVQDIGSLLLPELASGDSGSLVVDVTTNEIYGHVIASNPLGEGYVVPLIATMGQIKEFFGTDDVSLPQPLPLLSRLTTFYFETLQRQNAKIDENTNREVGQEDKPIPIYERTEEPVAILRKDNSTLSKFPFAKEQSGGKEEPEVQKNGLLAAGSYRSRRRAEEHRKAHEEINVLEADFHEDTGWPAEMRDMPIPAHERLTEIKAMPKIYRSKSASQSPTVKKNPDVKEEPGRRRYDRLTTGYNWKKYGDVGNSFPDGLLGLRSVEFVENDPADDSGYRSAVARFATFADATDADDGDFPPTYQLLSASDGKDELPSSTTSSSASITSTEPNSHVSSTRSVLKGSVPTQSLSSI
ncbi:uncharacterized protein RSE6_04296 [Rhynchosporium secalis]|uniref:Uncharacterized protein n=1 Tax=Rhynchosporium secalis TaxID=38038 RepID=A0A1E1M4Z1_RHYSE|nr:uncharacterized protein RSE6_04296 [Rhynchosporium secalis]